MPRHIKIGLIVLGVGFAIALGFFVDVVGRVQSMMKNERETEENPFKQPTQPLYTPTDPPMNVKLFFPPAGGDPLLTAEDATIFQSAEIENRAKQILQKLQEGPHIDSMVPSLPKDAKAQDLFISQEGIAFINFSNAIATNHPGGVLNELATIYSVVNSLTYNLQEIKEVKILIGGVEKETLAGHCLLLLPLSLDLSITNVKPREEKTASAAVGTTFNR
jgi:spore germination protein GerM